MNEEQLTPIRTDLAHHLILEDRKKLSITGVYEVERFDEQEVIVFTSAGKLTISGCDLKIGRLNVENGDLSVEGTVDSMEYTQSSYTKGGLFSRLFG